MPYATRAEIEADFKDLTFTSTTNVKDSDVSQFAFEASALIDGYVGTVYQVPISDQGLLTSDGDTLTTEELEMLVTGNGQGYLLLKLLCRSLVAARIKQIMEVKQEKNRDADQSVRGVFLSTSRVMEILKAIQKKEIILQGAIPLNTNLGFFSNNAANDIEPVMKKDEKLW